MELEDWMVYSEDLGKQINLMLSLGILSTVLYFLTTNYLLSSLIRSVLRATFLFEAAAYFGFTLILFKKWTDSVY